MKSSYGSLKELLSEGKAEKSWKEFKTKGEMEKVYRKSDGSVHWVRTSSVEVLVKSGLFRADQRYEEKDARESEGKEGEGKENTPSSGETKSEVSLEFFIYFFKRKKKEMKKICFCFYHCAGPHRRLFFSDTLSFPPFFLFSFSLHLNNLFHS